MGGGSKPAKPKLQKVPEAAEPLDYTKMFGAARENSRLIGQDQLDQLKAAYPEFEKLSLGTIQSYADKLTNEYTDNANESVDAASGQAVNMGAAGDRIGAVANRGENLSNAAQQFAQGPTGLDGQIASLGSSAMGQRADQVSGATVQGPRGYSPAEIRAQQISAAQAGPASNIQASSVGSPERVAGTRVAGVDPMQTARVGRVQDVRSNDIRSSAAEQALMREVSGGGISGQLQQQAAADLAQGRSLSAEQQRDATQAARAGFAARGMATGNSALSAELLNRDRYATQRQNERRNFASAALQQATGIQQAANQAYMGREDSNAGRAQQAAMANQSVAQSRAMQNAQFSQQGYTTDNQNAQQRVLAEAGYAQQAGLSNQDFSFRAGSQDAQMAQQAALANQQAGLTLGQSNAALQQQVALANQQAGLQSGQINQAAAARAAEFGQEGALRASLAQSGYDQQANLANQEANQRQVEANRAYLQNANASGINSEITRGNYAMGQLGQSANMYGQQAATSANAAALGLNIANANLAIDPYQRAFAPGASFGQNVTGQAGGMLGQAYGNALNTVGNVDTFNVNMLETRRNSALNNNASLQGSYMNAQAQQSAGQTGMWGSIAGGGLAAGGMIAGAAIIV